MPKKKKKKKESWKERQRRISIKHQRALEAERIRRERAPKKKGGFFSGKKVLALMVFLSIIVMSVIIYSTSQHNQSSLTNRKKAPNFTLTDINGNTFSLSDFRGKIVILDFFYVGCPYCDDEIVELEKIYAKYGGDKLEIISISVPEDSVEKLREFKKGPNSYSNLEYEMTWIIARDTAGVIDMYNVYGFPTTFIIDEEGYISPNSPFVGLTSEEKLLSEIDYLLSH